MDIDVNLKKKPNIKVSGAIDSSNNKHLYNAFKIAIQSAKELIIIDIRNVTYIDSAGLSAIVWLANQASKINVHIRLVTSATPILRLLDIVGLDKIKNLDLLIDYNFKLEKLTEKD